jgi:hypothetical protein
MKFIICVILGLSFSTKQKKIYEHKLYGRWNTNYSRHQSSENSYDIKIDSDWIEFNENRMYYASTNNKVDSGIWNFSAEENAIGYKEYSRLGIIKDRDFVYKHKAVLISRDTLELRLKRNADETVFILSK